MLVITYDVLYKKYMNSQVEAMLTGKGHAAIRHEMSSGELNKTYQLSDGNYLHVSPQYLAQSEEESLLLDRYYYPDKAAFMAKSVESAATIAMANALNNIVVPAILDFGEEFSHQSIVCLSTIDKRTILTMQLQPDL